LAFDITAGSGKTIAADVSGTAHNVTSGEQVQFVAQACGTLGSLALNTVTNPAFSQLTDATNSAKMGSATNIAAATSANSLQVVLPGQWTEYHAPAVNTQATKSHAAGAAGVRHVCTWVSFTLAQNTTGSAQTLIAFNLRDGATGAGTILASWTMALPATACESRTFSLSGLNIIGTAATAMTLETAAAPAANTAASVQFGGYSTV
jgi:hypothetical protein